MMSAINLETTNFPLEWWLGYPQLGTVDHHNSYWLRPDSLPFAGGLNDPTVELTDHLGLFSSFRVVSSSCRCCVHSVLYCVGTFPFLILLTLTFIF